MTPPPGAWSDLRARVLSAIVMVAIGAAAIWAGGLVFMALAGLIAGVIVWELARMTGVSQMTSGALSVLAVISVFAAKELGQPLDLGILLLPAAAGLIVSEKPALIAAFSVEIVIGCYALICVSEMGGALWVFFLVALVAASDILGYFAGRTFGGPKLWPRVSPKKTWSGTVAGWIGAALIGLGFALYAGVSVPLLIALSVVLAMAGQAGDIAESALKRHVGVKDSSALIPGHGGFFDRFDAMLGVGVTVWFIITFIGPWW